jgi:hypothetical protein
VERDKCNQPNRRAVVTAEVVSPDAPAAPAKAPAKKK